MYLTLYPSNSLIDEAGTMNALNLYRVLLREGRGFKDYPVREYVARRVKDDFRKNRDLAGDQLTHALEEGKKAYEMVCRQKVIGNLYYKSISVMETTK